MPNLSNRWTASEMFLVHQYKNKILEESEFGVSKKAESFKNLCSLLNALNANKRTKDAVCKKVRDTLNATNELLSRKQKRLKAKVESEENVNLIDRMDMEASERGREVDSYSKPSESFTSGVAYVPLEYVYGKVKMNEFLDMWSESKQINVQS